MDTEKTTVLVTGGRGFIGRAAVKALRGAEYRVISVDVTPCASDGEFQCDIAEMEQVRSVFRRERVAVIVHLAAVLPTAAQREPLRATRVNMQGSLNLLEMAREFSVRRFVLGSSLSVYGTCSADQVVAESHRAAPEDLYGAAKAYVEQLGSAYRLAHGLEFVSLRIGRVVGPGARSTTSAWRSEIFECMDGRSAEIVIPYAESERILLVHVEDVARMLVCLVRAPELANTIYNAACESVIVGELKREVERLNPGVRVTLDGQAVKGNPRRVDWSRFAGEFGFLVAPILEQLGQAATRA